MTRLSGFLWMAVIVAATVSLYVIKYRAQSVINQVAETSRQLEAEKAALHVANAEWAYLNRPQRLKMLAARYLSDSDLTAAQFADIKTIPLAPQMQAQAAHAGSVKQASMTIVK